MLRILIDLSSILCITFRYYLIVFRSFFKFEVESKGVGVPSLSLLQFACLFVFTAFVGVLSFSLLFLITKLVDIVSLASLKFLSHHYLLLVSGLILYRFPLWSFITTFFGVAVSLPSLEFYLITTFFGVVSSFLFVFLQTIFLFYLF